MNPETLPRALQQAALMESRREYASAAALLDTALSADGSSNISVRFRALVLRAEIAVSLNAEGESRGILAEARQAQTRLGKPEKQDLETEIRRADDLETFLTHRGCAG